MTGKRGFTLLEMVVATTIMAVAVVGLLAAISGATRNAARLREYDRAVQLARLRMNELLLDTELPVGAAVAGPFDRAETGGLDAGWRARLSLFVPPRDLRAGQLGLERVELEVWWVSGEQRRNFTLEGFRRTVLRPSDVPEAPK